VELPPDQYAAIDGHQLRYWESGSGVPLLLLHGLGNSALVWHKCIAALARTFRVFALDLPGHGLSDMPRVRYGLGDAARLAVAFMAANGVDRFHVAGNSMGGNIATELTLDHPDRLGNVVLVNPAGLGKWIAWFLCLASVLGVGGYFERPSIERCGHWPQIKYPDDFARIVTEFLSDASLQKPDRHSSVTS